MAITLEQVNVAPSLRKCLENIKRFITTQCFVESPLGVRGTWILLLTADKVLCINLDCIGLMLNELGIADIRTLRKHQLHEGL